MGSLFYLIHLSLLLCWAILVTAIDPIEKEQLHSFHDKLVGNGPPLWDFSGDPCSWKDYDKTGKFLTGAGVNCTSDNVHILKIYIVGMNAAGYIAPEIGNFTYLDDLNLAQNMLTGPIPKEIGKLRKVKYLSLSKNKLSGTLPPELGNMTSLITMGLGLNNFTGGLPKEIGDLSNLQEVYFDGNGLEGEIPTEYKRLTTMTIFKANNNNLNGSIPDIFANLTSLTILRLYGNKFQGQIPSSLWNITTLTELTMARNRFSNLSFPSSLTHMRSLNILSFRNCGLTGAIPAQIGGLTNLSYLDLSFNGFTGEIPGTFGSMTALNKLFLGSNNLTGGVPSELSRLSNLEYLDLSYNQLSGSIPTWLHRPSLQANLIWNLFDISNSNRLVAASFNCLDSKSPCTRTTTGRNVKFSINCGGQWLTPYADDNPSLAEYANFRIHSSKRWAVSTVGYVDKYATYETSNYHITTKMNVSNIVEGVEPLVYQTARTSPSSLRYFGLNMVNRNYSLKLHFAEIEISANQSDWQSTGKRVFDIYIQGEKAYEDFDIMDRANGSSKALMLNHTVQVTQGFLEVHLKWEEMGTCCIPRSKVFGPLISAIVVTPDFEYSPISHRRIIGICISTVGAFVLICIITTLCWRRRQKLLLARRAYEEDLKNIKNKPDIFAYNELKAATKGFHQENKLGEGGFGVVYKGVLPDGTIVAIKKLSSSISNKEEFINEAFMISLVKHRNLVRLLGCCVEEDKRILVLEFLENNSLLHALLGPPELRLDIDWSARYNICVEIAKGIAYLHEESVPRIIHRDIKASNILLDRKLHPKIADFGLATLFGDEQTHISTKVAGTMGYLSPEYATRGQLTEKLDVYSFGVLTLEIISGRKNLDLSLPQDQIYLLEWVMQLNKQNSLLQVIDHKLENQYSKAEAMTIIGVAILCTQSSPNKRPNMSKVVDMLTEPRKIIEYESTPKDKV